MTKAQAVQRLLSSFTVRAVRTEFDYDPAGSTSTYVPSKTDLALVEVLIGREVKESELFFVCGGSVRSHYGIRQSVIEEVQV